MEEKKKLHAIEDNKEDQEMQKRIKSRAYYSLALWGMAIAEHGSGQFVDLRPS